jgi:hypothetical protein
MKKQALLLALGFVLNAAPVALATTSIEQRYVDNYRGRTGTPIPVSVVSPYVGSDYIGTEFQLEFTVDERGRPKSIVSTSAVPADLLNRVTHAVSRWRFDPLRDANGAPVAADVVLPVHITEPVPR